MKIHLIVLLLTMAVTAAGAAGAAEGTGSPSPEELSVQTTHLIFGQIAKIEGQRYLVNEDGGGLIVVHVTAETEGPKDLRVGEQVMISVLANGIATVITSAHTEAEATALANGAQDAR